MIEIEKVIGNFCAANKSYFNHQLKCKLLKYEVRKSLLYTTSSRQRFPRLSWMVKHYYNQDYPEMFGDNIETSNEEQFNQ